MNLRESPLDFKNAFYSALSENIDEARCSLLLQIINMQKGGVADGWFERVSSRMTSKECLYPSNLMRLLTECADELKLFAESKCDEDHALSLLPDALRALTDDDIVCISKSLYTQVASGAPMIKGDLGSWSIFEIENFPDLQSLYSPKFEIFADGRKVGVIECRRIERRSGRIVWMYYARACGLVGSRKHELHYSLQGAWADVLTQAKEASRLAHDIRCSIVSNNEINND